MNILHINCNYIGTALHQTMIEHMVSDNVKCSVFCPTYDARNSVVSPEHYVSVVECFEKWDRFFFDYKQRKIIGAIEREYDISSFDCIHAYTLFTDGNCAMNISKKHNIPYVVAVRDTDVNCFLKYRFYLKNRALKIMENAKAVFFLSKSYQKIIMDKYVPDYLKREIEAKSYIIPNGVDEFWHKNKYMGDLNIRLDLLNKKKFTVAYAGRISRRKNIVSIQKALNIMKERGWKPSFVFAGKIENKRLFDKIVSYPDTKYYGALDKSGLLDLYRKSDVFVMPSFTETFGLVYAEALSQGLPVIYTKNQGFDMQFDEGVVGYHIDPNCANSIADAIERILINYQTILANIPESIQKYRWESIVDKYINIYKKITMTK